MTTFRPGTCDANVYRSVVELNEYLLPDALAPEGLILDVGGHIGSFTRACLDRGARRIVAFEPDPENFCRFRRHLAEEIAQGWVTVLPVAVTGSGFALVYLEPYLTTPEEVNTGGSAVTMSGSAGRGLRNLVPNVLLRDILDHLDDEPVALLKLDCEGSEWGILEGCDEPGPHGFLAESVLSVCGEFHPSSHPDSKSEATLQGSMLRLLKSRGFANVAVEVHGDGGLGLFWAKR